MQFYLLHRLAKKPISLVGTALRIIYTQSYGVALSSACCNARYKEMKVFPVPAAP